MSGGTFDYVQYRVADAIDTINDRLSRNGKTVLELWNETPEDERSCLAYYERPWTTEDHPNWIEDEAMKEANKALNVRELGNFRMFPENQKTFNQLSKKELNEWNRIRNEAIKRLVDEHNESSAGEDYSEKTVEKIKEMLVTIKKAEIYLQRIDWLFAGDDGEDNFLERTEEDLKEAGLE